MPRCDRTKSSTPSSRSSDFSRAVIAGCVRKSASAARLTFPRRATSTKLSSCAKSIGSCGISLPFIGLIRTNDLPDDHRGTESATSSPMDTQMVTQEVDMTEIEERIEEQKTRGQML